MSRHLLLTVALAAVLLVPSASATLVYAGRPIPDLIVKIGDDCYHVWPPGGTQGCCVGPPTITCIDGDVRVWFSLP